MASATCAADGAWSASVNLPQTGTVRARFPGDATRGPLESSDLEITILPKLAMALSSSHIRRGRRVGVSGVLTPALAARVDLKLERKVGRRYRKVRLRRIRVREYRFLAFLRIRRRGLYRVTVSTPGARIRRYVRVS
jgi:hypothetical protein